MRICLLDLNKFEVTGETTYLIHMRPSLIKLGLDAEIVVCSPLGKRGKYNSNYTEGVTWVKDKNVLEYISQFDVIHVNNGRFGEKEYKFLQGFDEIKKIKTMQIHGVTQSTGYSMPVLIDIVKPKALFNVDPNGVVEYKKLHKDVTWVELHLYVARPK